MADNTIHNLNKIRRIIDFSGLPHIGSCSPTDIDLCIEVGDHKKYLIADFKERGKELSEGQRILLERHCKAFSNGLKYESLALLVWHEPNLTIINAAESSVVMKYVLEEEQEEGTWEQCKNESFLNEYCLFFCEIPPEVVIKIKTRENLIYDMEF